MSVNAAGSPALVIALLGAESTGKSTLAEQGAARLAEATGLRCIGVPEVLRSWCDERGRVPQQHEQAAIARAQGQAIEAAAATHELVLADTTPLQVAVYSEQVFADRSLMAEALAWHQRHCALTLLTALDLPWVADGLRDGPHAQGPTDALLRQALIGAGLPWSLLAGSGAARVDALLDALTPLLQRRREPLPRAGLFTRLAEREAAEPAWRWTCEQCDAPECEHALRRAPGAGAELSRR